MKSKNRRVNELLHRIGTITGNALGVAVGAFVDSFVEEYNSCKTGMDGRKDTNNKPINEKGDGNA